jgi:predicted RNase H-like HicB family nuclease
MDHGAVTGGETREEALTHIENVISMILAEMESGGVSPPPDEPVPGGILLTIEAE